MDNIRVLWLIAARSGSKSIPNKNIKLLGGQPLLAYRIKSVSAFANLKDIVVSTDSAEYADIARAYGASVPFLRPAELASDSAKSVDVVLHAMQWAEDQSCEYDAIGLLEPTSPFVTTRQLQLALQSLFRDENAECIVATRRVRPSTFYVQKNEEYLAILARRINSLGVLRRQEENVEITPSGGFYISKWDAMKQNKSFYLEKTQSFLLPDINALEIDELLDWDWAEFLIERKMLDIDQLISLD